MEVYIQLLIYLAPLAIVGIVTWVWLLWTAHHNLKLHIAEHYIKKADLHELKKDIRNLTNLSYRIAGKLGLPLTNED